MKISEFNIARDLNRVLKLLKGEDEISECFRNAAESDHASEKEIMEAFRLHGMLEEEMTL